MRTVYLNTRKRAQTLLVRCCSTRSLLLAVAVDIYLGEKRGSTGETEGLTKGGDLGEIRKVQTWLKPFSRLKLGFFWGQMKSTEK